MNDRVLLVDDDPNVLRGFERHLRRKFNVELAIGGRSAIEMLEADDSFAVVVSDMQMPGMSGVELLREVASRDANIIRIMLTGNADQRTAVDAVNQGNIFRFMTKPCSPEQLSAAIEAGLEQYRLVTAEAELLSQTLAGSVRMLTQVLSLSMPEAFGMTGETRTLSRAVAERLTADGIEIGPLWQVEMAAMLMRIGLVSLPPDVRMRYLNREMLTADERRMVLQTPRVGRDLIASIPRLGGVASWVADQNEPPRGDTPMASRILKAVGDFQRRRSQASPFAALEDLTDPSIYDPAVIAALTDAVSTHCEVRRVNVDQLHQHMILESDVTDKAGRVLIAKGNEVHDAVIQKLHMLRRSGAGVSEPIEVRLLALPAAAARC